MPRDIDYAAIAVKNAITEKFGRATELSGLEVTAGDRTIEVRDAGRVLEGSRDQILAAVRAAGSYEALWQSDPTHRE